MENKVTHKNQNSTAKKAHLQYQICEHHLMQD